MEEESNIQNQELESDRRRPSASSSASSSAPLLSSTSTMSGRERNTRSEMDAEEEDSELEKMMERYPRFMAFWDSPPCACVRHTLFYIGSYFPVLLISALFCLGYYLFVHVLCVTHLIIAGKLLHLAVFLLFLFHFLFLLAVISFLRAVFSDPGYVQPSFHSLVEERVLRDSEEDEEREKGTPEEEERKRMLRVRATACRKCRVGGGTEGQYRPLRGHHCSVCRKCVRKMDHHCPVIANCVGWGNYKYFLLMLIHSGVVCLFGSMCVVLKFLLMGWSQSSSGSEVLLLVVGLVAFLYSLILLLFGLYHVHLTLRNVTTLENMTYSHSRSNRKNPFDVGRKENWRQVFGDSPLLWFVPVWSSKGDGYDFPVNEELQVSYIV